MWKVIIADDEPKIREGLHGLLESFDLSLKVCGKAKNGLDALALVEQEKPDLMLIDICMPKLNGLELIKEIRKRDKLVKIVIVTGFNEFTYAREALVLGVQNYILKPVKEEELYRYMKKLVEEMEAERAKEKFLELAGGQADLFSVHIKKQALLVLMAIRKEYDMEGRAGEADLMQKHWRQVLKRLFSELPGEYEECYVFTDRYQNIIAISNSRSLNIKEDRERLLLRLERELGDCCRAEVRVCAKDTLPEIYEEICREIRSEAGYSPLVAEAKRYIREHYMEQELDLSVVGNAIGVNHAYLSRLMKQELGMPFKDFLTRQRIQTAISLMSNGNLSLNEIADRVGYSSQHYFSTAFKNSMGVSPSEYRKQKGRG